MAEPSDGPLAIGAWGIDACLSVFTDPPERARYLDLLSGTGIDVLRERGPSASLLELKGAGHRVVAFVHLAGLKPAQIGNALPEELGAVFAAARAMVRDYQGIVDAWEMVGEPDIGYCPDLPDRLAAYQKAVYLGIKRGAQDAAFTRAASPPSAAPSSVGTADRPESRGAAYTRPSTEVQTPLVLMGALGLPPGPWLDRAIRNGLLDYTDAYNVHFYGHAVDLTGVIRAHSRVAFRDGERDLAERGFHKAPLLRPAVPRPIELPLWITECGINAVTNADFFNAERRQLQADFTVSTASQALAASRVSLFMPFILVHKGDGHALTVSPEQPLLAWTAYAAFMREHPWPARPLATPPPAPNPVVVQWLPDNATTWAHKVSGTYRFRARAPITGEFRLYNFSDRPVRGRLSLSVPLSVTSTFPIQATLALAPGAMITVCGDFHPTRAGYAQTWVEGAFVDEAQRRSPVYFGLETWPEEGDFVASPVALTPLPDGRTAFPVEANYRPSMTVGTWQGINGVTVAASRPRGGDFAVAAISDPLFPPMAITGVAGGLPRDGFLVLHLDQPMKPGHMVLVQLVDDRGQRYTIWENFGHSYFRPAERDLWLNIRDFHPYFWGRCADDPALRPERIREIQLMFYTRQPGECFNVDFSWRAPRR